MTTTKRLSFAFLKRKTLIGGTIVVSLAAAMSGAGALGQFFSSIATNVPPIDAVTNYQPKIPLRVYSADKVLLGEFGVERREFLSLSQIPLLMRQAVLSVEDKRFYQHGGIDWIRAAGALRANLAGGYREGASTITMQVARNFFLTRDKVIARKVNEVALAYKIEQALSKDQILELYMNQIFLGRRSYGFGSAAHAYFGKPLSALSLAQMAMLAGVPRDPVRDNPSASPQRAKQRQMLILRLMREQGYITAAQYKSAAAEPIRVAAKGQEFGTSADYVAELARQAVYAQFKEDSYTKGIVVITTIRKADQDAARAALRRQVLAYDGRHGYRGPEARISLPGDAAERDRAIDAALRKRPAVDGLTPALVLKASASKLTVQTQDGQRIEIGPDGLRFAARALAANARPALKLSAGALVRISRTGKQQWAVVQLPEVAAGFVAIDAGTGAYRALVGGFEFGLQQFNHVTQAWRQPGSVIKPFVYSAALEKGFSPGTLILDDTLEIPGPKAGSVWSPQNDDGQLEGVVTMRQALTRSKNIASVRLLRAATVPHVHQHLEKFGFDLSKHPRNLTLALGTGSVTALQLAGAYAVIANGGYQVKPYLISRIEDANGKLIFETKTPAVGQESARVIDRRNVFLVDSMLIDVARFGTAAGASTSLGRLDLAGKTGTTNDALDGWFAGYAGKVVGVAWMGYDEPRSLGGREFGSTLAMPIWVDYMRVALAGRAPEERPVPEGIVHDGSDWLYAEYADTIDFMGIDIDSYQHLYDTADSESEAAPQAELPWFE